MIPLYAPPIHGVWPTWREFYQAAICETDRTRMVVRILEAERELVRRERQLFLTPGNEQELNALNAALHELDALRSCFEVGGPSADNRRRMPPAAAQTAELAEVAA